MLNKRTWWQTALALGALVASEGGLQAAPYTEGNAAWNVNKNPDGSNPAAYFGEWQGHSYHPSPVDWRRESVYQFITDRFRDGDPSNNESAYGGYELYKVNARHGGDFKGIADKLDYIKSLGYTSIWISPVFQNEDNSYHGYAQIDFTTLDQRFGTLEDFRAMVKKAHSLGMYVIVDIVVNHMANRLYFEGHPASGASFRLHNGEYRLFERIPGLGYEDFKVDNTFYPNGTYAPVYGNDGYIRYDAGQGEGSFWFSDFHHNGDLGDYGDPWQNHLGKIYGSMDDLRTTHPRVQDKIIAMTKALISSTDIDGIRMDTPMQVPLEFFQRWVPAVKEHARWLGKDNFMIYGEFYVNRGRAATMVGRGRSPNQWGQESFINPFAYTMDSGINYDLYFSFFQPGVKDQGTGHLGKLFETLKQDKIAYDFYNPARGETRYRMLNFYNNHDQWRMNWSPDGFRKSILASGIIAFWPGIPLFYYGDEQDLASQGTALDGWSREDMMTSKAWYDVASFPAGRGYNPAQFDNFNMTHSTYRAVQKFMNVRRQYRALQTSDEVYERWIQSQGNPGIAAFSRVWGPQRDWALVAFNTWKFGLTAGGDQGAFYTGWETGRVIVNALNPSERYVLGQDGKLDSLYLDGYEVKVFVTEENYQSLDPVVEAIYPEHDAVVSADQAENVRLRFSEDMDQASVMSSLRVDGAQLLRDSCAWENARSLQCGLQVESDLVKIRLEESAKAQSGKHVYGAFESRFRRQKTDSSNPIVKTQKEFLQVKGLVESYQAETRQISLRHVAPGAKYMRVSTKLGEWSAWQPYAQASQHALPDDHAADKVYVQYWADGSAAYFAYDSLL